MAGLYMYQGLFRMLQFVLHEGLSPLGGVVLKLFVNNITPALANNSASFTEPSDPSYAAIPLVIGDFAFSTDSNGELATMAQQMFTFSGGDSVYGYYLVDPGNLMVLCAERFTSAPIVIPGGGGPLYVDAVLRLDSPC